ncbi:uncharacterized protein LOC111401769 [Olea europaea var. sylvestris]|uniref:uncharacterized protein LOC111401769 n=1 Tax=Olea europaea var. sylvestris TaxID=158386 RepID=UPI000C1D228F|nr:uncharacterized protein LOC111401769 [Olea europaea var. sylvestris]XP_022885427.1 uncharacterized protein LOC111401769 [Olea europaea var. sylvestris]
MDGMALVQRYGKPDVFLTITCNPNWPEIEQELRHNDEKQNRPYLLTRIFRAKFEELKNDLFRRHILGPIVAYVYVIEFQKRGLAHAHFLLIFKSRSKVTSVDLVDKIVCCKIPEKNRYPHLHPIVVKHMLHGPSGTLNPNNVCMENNKIFKNKYPREYVITTLLGDNSYPQYSCRNDGQQVKVRGHLLDNKWVVPYNPYLTAKYDRHINIKICSTVKVVKYLYKYVYKGHDRITFSINDNEQDVDIDEISKYQTVKWISPPKAMWRIYGFMLSEMSPSVVSLQLHLEDHQLITYRDTDNS